MVTILKKKLTKEIESFLMEMRREEKE